MEVVFLFCKYKWIDEDDVGVKIRSGAGGGRDDEITCMLIRFHKWPF